MSKLPAHNSITKKDDAMSNIQTKTLEDVKRDMSELYDQVRDGSCDIKLAGELANITGKYLKAVQLDLATEIFMSNQPPRLAIENAA